MPVSSGFFALTTGFAACTPLLADAASSGSLSTFEPASSSAGGIRDLFVMILAITGVIFLLVEGMLLFCILRFRQKPSEAGVEPPQLYGSKPIEVAWTLAPVLIVFVLFLVVFRTSAEVRNEPPDKDALHITVVGHQWWWEYRYTDPELGFVTANEMHVPTGEPGKPGRAVLFDLQSADVIHSFWVPRLAGKTDVIPGRQNKTWFRVDQGKEGLYLGQCAEYCGTQHANMMLRVVAESPSDFGAWVANQKKPADDDAAARAARKPFLALSCQNCHTIRGTMAKGIFGPDLTHLMSRETLVTGMVPNDKQNLTTWIDDPARIKPGCLMPSMHLSKAQVEEVVSYLLTLR